MLFKKHLIIALLVSTSLFGESVDFYKQGINSVDNVTFLQEQLPKIEKELSAQIEAFKNSTVEQMEAMFGPCTSPTSSGCAAYLGLPNPAEALKIAEEVSTKIGDISKIFSSDEWADLPLSDLNAKFSEITNEYNRILQSQELGNIQAIAGGKTIQEALGVTSVGNLSSAFNQTFANCCCSSEISKKIEDLDKEVTAELSATQKELDKVNQQLSKDFQNSIIAEFYQASKANSLLVGLIQEGKIQENESLKTQQCLAIDARITEINHALLEAEMQLYSLVKKQNRSK